MGAAGRPDRRVHRLHRAQPDAGRRARARGVEIGWRLARHAWHHGYATEAARAALAVAFDGIGLHEISSITAVLNEPSQAVMRRLGLTEVARFDHPRVPAGHPLCPHVTYHRSRSQAS